MGVAGAGGSAARERERVAALEALWRQSAPATCRQFSWHPHQSRHRTATHLGEQRVDSGSRMDKIRHSAPRPATRRARPPAGAVTEIAEFLDTEPQRSG